MYINLFLGAVALVVVWLFLRRLLVRKDELTVSPARLLEKELAKRREKEEKTSAAFERLRDVTVARMRPVADALVEIRAAMPEREKERLSWRDGGDSIAIHMRPAGTEQRPEEDGRPALTVTWRSREVVLGGNTPAGGSGEYVLLNQEEAEGARAASIDDCVRAITSFIVAFMH